MTTIPSCKPGYSFPNLSGMSKQEYKDIGKQLTYVHTLFHNHNAHAVCRRLEDLDKTNITLGVLKMFHPERALDDLAEARSKWLHRLSLFRNMLALFPLLLTWI